MPFDRKHGGLVVVQAENSSMSAIEWPGKMKCARALVL